jgi:hyperosmotically inducible protein
MLNKTFRKRLVLPAILTIFFFGLTGSALASAKAGQTPSLAEEVAHKLNMLPYYGVFDNLSFTIKDQNTVVLTGQIVNDIVKRDAETAVRSIKGAGKIINDIEILPLSRFDDNIRIATYWAIYSKSGFEKYAIRADKPIKIIVKNGRVTLVGFVHNELEKTMARLAANSVPGVFSVTDELEIG